MPEGVTVDAIKKLGEEMLWKPNWTDHTYTFWVLYLRDEDGCFYVQEDFPEPSGPIVRYYNFETSIASNGPLSADFAAQIEEVRNEILKPYQERNGDE
jgi:hypothetical protein